MKTFLLPILLICFISLAVVANGQHQESNAKAEKAKPALPTGEKFEMEALAMAYVKCKTDLARHGSDLDDQNNLLKVEYQNLVILQSKFEIKYFTRFAADTAYYDDFKKEVEKVKKELTVCIEYQKILDSVDDPVK